MSDSDCKSPMLVRVRDILDQLRTDAGQLTIATLIQQREAAASEIVRLRETITHLGSAQQQMGRNAPQPLANRSLPAHTDAPSRGSAPPCNTPSTTLRPERGALLRLKDVCSLVGVGRTTVYAWIAHRKFPQPVQVGARAVRWKTEDLDAWRASLETSRRS